MEEPQKEDILQNYEAMLIRFEEELKRDTEKPLTTKEIEMLFSMVNTIAQRSMVYLQEILLGDAGTVPTSILLFAIARLEFVMQCYTYRNTVKDKLELLSQTIFQCKAALIQ